MEGVCVQELACLVDGIRRRSVPGTRTEKIDVSRWAANTCLTEKNQQAAKEQQHSCTRGYNGLVE